MGKGQDRDSAKCLDRPEKVLLLANGQLSNPAEGDLRSEADQDSGGKPITHSGAKPISDSGLKAISNRPTSGMVIGFSGVFSTGV
jgi:hypothetical protein